MEQGNRGGGHVLVVEDDGVLAKLVVVALENAGFSVDTAENGLDALRLIQRCQFDVVITDIGIPGMSGHDLLEHVRLTKPNLPVVVMTASCNPRTEEKTMALGAAAVLQKPFSSLKEVVAVLRRAMAEPR